jgi:hypothetical protein
MTELMPADGEQLKWVDDLTCARDVPQGENNHTIDGDLGGSKAGTISSPDIR